MASTFVGAESDLTSCVELFLLFAKKPIPVNIADRSY